MVVRMKNGKNIRGALSYNEAKVRTGKAELILASRFGCNAEELSFSQKLKRFEVLNENCVTSSFNTVHISLNFPAADRMDTEKMQLIARDYMQALGFEKQPFLVYRHNDTAHPHLHIVTTPVKSNGRTINLHNLVQRKSEPARKNLEVVYGLIKAESRQPAQVIHKVSPEVVTYEKAETKQAVAQVVRIVADNWRFCSFEEYNLVLAQFGVTADKGSVGSKMRQHGGLNYFIIDRRGEKISVPIKASSIYTSPTLKNIEQKFVRNAQRKKAALHFTHATVHAALKRSGSQYVFFKALLDKKITTVRYGSDLLFIDHRCRLVVSSKELAIDINNVQSLDKTQRAQYSFDHSLTQRLLSPEFTGPDLASAFLKKKKKKKK